MKKVDVQAGLQEGFEPSPVTLAADGMPVLPPIRAPLPPRPRLCEAGPCQNYHRLEIQLEATDPRPELVRIRLDKPMPGAQSTPQGTVYQAPAAFHTEVHHYCYPTTGIEMELGAMPVVHCNRWDPLSQAGELQQAMAVTAFWQSRAGEEYRSAVQAWDRARDQESREAAEIEQLIADSVRAAEAAAQPSTKDEKEP